MFTDKFMEVVGKEGVVSIVSCANNEAHVVNTWNSYLRIPEDGKILLPAWAMRKTEKNTLENNKLLLTVGSKEVEGRMGQGCGFYLEGTANFITSGEVYDKMKAEYGFLTRVLEVTVTELKQTV